jgi:hypothetical protein
MSRQKGTFNHPYNIEALKKAPLDARQKVELYSDLTDPSTWMDNEGLIWLYDGAMVVVSNDTDALNGIYYLKDASNYTDANNWSKPVRDVSVLNVGDGSANVFKEIDPSTEAILLRSIIGASAVDISQTADNIVIGIDASFGGEVNSGMNIGSGDASVFDEKVGNNLRFRELKSGDGINIGYSDPDTIQVDVSLDAFVKESSLGDDFSFDASGLLQVDISAGGSGTYDTTLDPSLTMPEDVGGITAGTTVADLQGDTFISIFDDLLFPTVDPTFVNPNNSFSDNVSSLQEVGAFIDPTFTATFDKGDILVSGNFQDFRSGDPSSYNYTDPSSNTLLLDVNTSLLSNIQTINNYLVTIGTQQFTNTVTYKEGPQPLDNKGNPSGSPYPAGTTSAKSVSFEGVYPLFATTSNITTMTKQSLVSMLSGNNVVIVMVAESGGNKQTFDIPDAWENAPTNRPLTGVETFNTVSGSWEYQGGSAGTSLTFWTQTTTTQTVQGNVINYNRYTYNGSDRSSINIRLKF